VDITVDQIQSASPLSVREVAPPSGGAWGSTYIDKAFRTIVLDVLGPRNAKHLDSATLLDVLRACEAGKRTVGRSGSSNDMGLVMAEVITDLNRADSTFNAASFKALVEEYNARNEGMPRLLFSERTRRLIIPDELVVRIMSVIVDSIVDHVADRLENAASPQFVHHPVDFLLVVGGFSESPLLFQVSPPPPRSPHTTRAMARGRGAGG